MPAIPLLSQMVMIVTVPLSRTRMGSQAGIDCRAAKVSKAGMGGSLPLITPLRLDPTASQVNITNKAASTGGKSYSTEPTQQHRRLWAGVWSISWTRRQLE